MAKATEATHAFHTILGSKDAIARGMLFTGPLHSVSRSDYLPVSAQGIFVRTGTGIPLLVSIHKADSKKVTIHGVEREWVFFVVDGPTSRYLRLNPMTEELEITALADASTRFLVSLNQLSPTVTMIDIHGTAMQMHQTFTPTLSTNAVHTARNGAITVRPTGRPETGLFLIT